MSPLGHANGAVFSAQRGEVFYFMWQGVPQSKYQLLGRSWLSASCSWLEVLLFLWNIVAGEVQVGVQARGMRSLW